VALFNAQRQYSLAKAALVQAQAARYADTAALVPGTGRGLVESRASGFRAGGASRLSGKGRIQGVASMTKRMIIMLAIVGVLFGGCSVSKPFWGT